MSARPTPASPAGAEARPTAAGGRSTAGDDVTGNARMALAIAAVATFVLPMIPFVGILLRPFVWLQTFAHELGHGVVGSVVGEGMFTIRVFLDGSGVTRHDHGPSVAWLQGLVSIGGLVGPAFAAAFFFVAARRRALSRVALVVLGVIFVAGAVVVVDNLFGRVVVGAWGLLLALLGARLSPSRAQVACAFAGVDLGLSVFSRGDYLFTDTANTSEGKLASDVAQVAQSFGGLYLLWGVAIGLFSVVVVAAGLFFLLRRR